MIAMIKTIMDKIGNGVSSAYFSFRPSPDIVFEQGSCFFPLDFPLPSLTGKRIIGKGMELGGKGTRRGTNVSSELRGR